MLRSEAAVGGAIRLSTVTVHDLILYQLAFNPPHFRRDNGPHVPTHGTTVPMPADSRAVEVGTLRHYHVSTAAGACHVWVRRAARMQS